MIRPHPQGPGALVGLIHCTPGEDPEASLQEILAFPFSSPSLPNYPFLMNICA